MTPHWRRHDELIVLAVLGLVVALAWSYLVFGAPARGTGGMPPMPMTPHWSAGYAVTMFVMWAGMMVAMMLPAATPQFLLVFAALREHARRRASGSTSLFVTGYLLAWVGFSVVATLVQWGLSRIGALSTSMSSNSATVSGAMLLAIGLYQWSWLKQACLAHCRSPADLLVRHWRRGMIGPVLAGLRLGAYCLGCCGLLMALLFIGGVMNLVWVAAIALLVLLEKLLAAGRVFSHLTGAALVLAGVAVLFGHWTL